MEVLSMTQRIKAQKGIITDFALWAAPLHRKGRWAKITTLSTPLWLTQKPGVQF